MSVLVRNDPVVVETARVDQGVKTSADNETEENVPQGGEPDLGTRDLHMETEGNKDDHQKDVSTLEKVEAELRDEEGINGALADQSSKKDADGILLPTRPYSKPTLWSPSSLRELSNRHSHVSFGSMCAFCAKSVLKWAI